MRFLHEVLDIFFPPRRTAVLVRSLAPDALRARMRVATIHVRGVPIIALLPYRDPVVQACILEAKFHANRSAQEQLGSALAAFLRDIDAPISLIPVPLSAERLKSRGYNQVERICEAALRQLPASVCLETDLLVRTRDTPPQTSLSGLARRQNLVNAFAVTRDPDPGHTYILIDDVMTTGATLLETRTALKTTSILISLAH